MFLSPQRERLAREEMIRQQNMAYQESLFADREKVGLAALCDSTSGVYQCMHTSCHVQLKQKKEEELLKEQKAKEEEEQRQEKEVCDG